MQINVNVNISLSMHKNPFPLMGSKMYVIEQGRYKEGTLGSWCLIPTDDDGWLDKEKDRHLITTTKIQPQFTLSRSLSALPPYGFKMCKFVGLICMLLSLG